MLCDTKQVIISQNRFWTIVFNISGKLYFKMKRKYFFLFLIFNHKKIKRIARICVCHAEIHYSNTYLICIYMYIHTHTHTHTCKHR